METSAVGALLSLGEIQQAHSFGILFLIPFSITHAEKNNPNDARKHFKSARDSTVVYLHFGVNSSAKSMRIENFAYNGMRLSVMTSLPYCAKAKFGLGSESTLSLRPPAHSSSF